MINRTFSKKLRFNMETKVERRFSIPMKAIISRKNASYYRLASICEGWRLVETPELSIIEEMVPSGAKDVLHYHNKAWQFFFVVDGMASFEVDGRSHQLRKGQGFEVEPCVHHRVINRSDRNVVFLVISAPTATGDRVDV